MINDVNHALDVIARKLGIANLDFSADGQVGVDVSPDLTVFLTRVEDNILEVSCLLEYLDYPDAAIMQAMLEANFLGGGVSGGRLALDADKSEAIICEALTVTELSADVLEKRFMEFCSLAKFWKDDGTTLLLEQADAIRTRYVGEPAEGAPSGELEQEAVVYVRP